MGKAAAAQHVRRWARFITQSAGSHKETISSLRQLLWLAKPIGYSLSLSTYWNWEAARAAAAVCLPLAGAHYCRRIESMGLDCRATCLPARADLLLRAARAMASPPTRRLPVCLSAAVTWRVSVRERACTSVSARLALCARQPEQSRPPRRCVRERALNRVVRWQRTTPCWNFSSFRLCRRRRRLISNSVHQFLLDERERSHNAQK